MRNKVKGFTLIELMVTLAVLALLSAIATPVYTNIVRKSHRADARVAVAVISTAQERYFTVNGRYANTLSSLSISTDLQGGNTEGGYYSVAVTASTTTFAVTATAGSSQADDDCDSMSINQLGIKSETGSHCW